VDLVVIAIQEESGQTFEIRTNIRTKIQDTHTKNKNKRINKKVENKQTQKGRERKEEEKRGQKEIMLFIGKPKGRSIMISNRGQKRVKEKKKREGLGG